MEENKFEKKVQQTMDELKIQPSAELWGKIEGRIGKEKRRRWGLILIFLLLFIAAGGGFWFWNSSRQSPSQNGLVQNSNKENSFHKNDVQENESGEKISGHLDSVNHKNNPVKESAFNRKYYYNKLISRSKSSSQANTNMQKTKVHQNAILTSSEPSSANSATSGDLQSKKDSGEGEIQSSFEYEQKLPHEKNDNTTINSRIPVDLPSSAQMNDILKKPIAKDEFAKDLPGKSLPKIMDPVLKNKWHPGIVLGAGISGSGTNFFNTRSSVANYLTSPGSSNATGGNVMYHTSNVTNGFGFIIGFDEEKNITPKTKISFGLNFTSSGLKYKADSLNTFSSFTNSRDPRNYNAHYNFITIPANIKVQIGKKTNLFYWQVGTIVSQLLGTNALQYNASAGYYYKDNSVFNKIQIGLNTGIYITLFSKQRTPLSIGPYFYYSLSKISNEGLYGNKHFSFAGITTHLQLVK